MKEKVLEVLKGVCPSVDFENCTTLIDDGIIESFDVISIVSELMEVFEIEIDADDIEPENLNSLDAICAMVERKQAENE